MSRLKPVYVLPAILKKELRRAVRESVPEVVARCSDTARVYRRVLAKAASGGDGLVKEAIVERAGCWRGSSPARTPRRSRSCWRSA